MRDLRTAGALAAGAVVVGLLSGCGATVATGTTAIVSDTGGAIVPTGVPAVFTKYTAAVTITLDGDYVVLRAKGVPDHKSPYFSASDSRYEAYNGTNKRASH
jgi:hypothetical protein